jgi:5'-3' exonuclease
MIIIDFNQTFISNFMAETRGRPDVEVNVDLLRHMILNQIRGYRNRFGNQYGEVVIACDNRHYWRRDVYPYYKASRKKSRDSSGHDWSSIFDALHMIRSELDEFMPYPVLDIDGAEADDVIGALAEYSQTSKEGALFDEPEPLLIISGDHDFQQLQKFPNVQQYSPMKKKMVKLTESPQEVLMEHIITGDKGDGVPNILSSDDTFVTEGKRQKPIRKNLLAEWKKQKPEEFITGEMASGYVRNKQLVDLSMTPQEIKDDVISSYEKQKGKSRAQLLNYFIKYRLKNMIEVAEDF